jgi:hypothetical protein
MIAMAINKLERMGYRFKVEGKSIQYEFKGDNHPDPAIVWPLLEELKSHKADLLHWFRIREKLTAYRDWPLPASECWSCRMLSDVGMEPCAMHVG